MKALMKMQDEAKRELLYDIIPFWKKLKDETYGGYYGFVSYDLKVDKKAEKGCILNSRIVWFFSNAYRMYMDGFITEKECLNAGYTGESLREDADHAYQFLLAHCLDCECGGIYWSLTYDGKPLDTTKHTYNQAFAIYALSSYFEISKDKKALELARELIEIIEGKCKDEVGYLEAFDREFKPESNEKLSENGVLAEKTMNTLLHVFEAYTEYYRVSKDAQAKKKLQWILDVFAKKIYNPLRHRQEVFFDAQYESILDLHSYGHDIETAWLIDWGVEVIEDACYEKKMTPITKDLTREIFQIAFDGNSLANECDRGTVDENRIWWVQAETVIGFLNGYEKDRSQEKYAVAAEAVWNFIQTYIVDKRTGAEWFYLLKKDGSPVEGKPIVESWKCPYHNGRMCMEIIRRTEKLLQKQE